MLSRLADNLFWMARYCERAENIARNLEINLRMTLWDRAGADDPEWWEAAVRVSGDPEEFKARHGAAGQKTVVEHLILDRDNPSSIWCCFERARDNARATRGKITVETWEAVNAIWLEIQDLTAAKLQRQGAREFCDWVKARCHGLRGVTDGTMLRDDAYRFSRLGLFLERADNTARLLDVRYHMLLPEGAALRESGAVDYYHWGAILRAVSAFSAYRRIYRDQIVPLRVAELLILRQDMPRSLHACMNEVTTVLGELGPGLECARLAGALHAELHFTRIEDVFRDRLSSFLNRHLAQANALGARIAKDFLMVA
ncbi:MAG: alpha-E domain-containing protein [Alphaproteobacteria bacterium]|nr:alpha-E domain-containing protein [Alphaproteobacteria bacterium]